MRSIFCVLAKQWFLLNPSYCHNVEFKIDIIWTSGRFPRFFHFAHIASLLADTNLHCSHFVLFLKMNFALFCILFE